MGLFEEVFLYKELTLHRITQYEKETSSPYTSLQTDATKSMATFCLHGVLHGQQADTTVLIWKHWVYEFVVVTSELSTFLVVFIV